jgi:hypothetical protein
VFEHKTKLRWTPYPSNHMESGFCNLGFWFSDLTIMWEVSISATDFHIKSTRDDGRRVYIIETENNRSLKTEEQFSVLSFSSEKFQFQHLLSFILLQQLLHLCSNLHCKKNICNHLLYLWTPNGKYKSKARLSCQPTLSCNSYHKCLGLMNSASALFNSCYHLIASLLRFNLNFTNFHMQR